MNPRDQAAGEGRGDISELPGGFPARAPQPPGRARTGTYPSCQRGRRHSTPRPAPRTRSQLAAAASLASCELCAAGGTCGGPSWSARVPSLGADGELRRPERYLWRSDAQLRGERLPAKASWPAGKVGGEAGRREVRARGAAGAQSPARGVRAPRTMAPGRGGDAGTVALAALARRAGAVPALEPLPARSASARSAGRSPGSSARGAPAGSTQCAPAPRAAAPTRSILPLQVWRRPPKHRSPASRRAQARAAERARAGRRQAGAPRDLRPSRRTASTSALPGVSSPRELSLRLPAPASARPWRLPPAALASLLLPSRPPLTPLLSTCTPPRGRTRPCAPPFPP